MRGGGLYALGFAVTFIVLELGSVVEDAKEFGLLLDGRVVDFVLNFVIDSFKNTLSAFMWPVTILKLAPPWGLIALCAGFVAFPRFLKKPIDDWLFDAERDEDEKS